MGMELALPRTQFPLYEHKVRSKLEDLISRVFSAPFAKTFSAPLGGAAATAIPWYLSGGIAAANCIAAYDAKNAASQAASYDNLASAATTYDLTATAAPTWAAGTGWTFNGSTQFLKTALVHPGYPGDENWSIIVRFANGVITSGTHYPCGTGAGGISRRFGIGSYYHTLGRIYMSSQGYVIANATGIATGIMAVAGLQGYLNGVSDGEAITPINGVNTADIYIGATNENDLADLFFVGDIIAVAIYNVNIATNIVALNTAMAAL